ncbi:hypothetical protein [Povalibacter uvarum]|nr:hypothetical protein [Povalibacter uvarum]
MSRSWIAHPAWVRLQSDVIAEGDASHDVIPANAGIHLPAA